MKVYQLFEDEYELNSPKDKNLDDLIQRIDNECSDMLAAYKKSKMVLFRGMNSSRDIVETKIRPDRKPVEMSIDNHEALHNAFLEIGLKATRKNSIFCTTSAETASVWGDNTYIIFVKDGWTATIFSQFKKDYAFDRLQWLAAKFKDDVPKLASEIVGLGPKTIDTIDGLKNVLTEKYEDIIITGDSYIAIKADALSTKYILKELGLSKSINI